MNNGKECTTDNVPSNGKKPLQSRDLTIRWTTVLQ
jgi:hypothetical protein